METSAKAKIGVEEAFMAIARAIKDKMDRVRGLSVSFSHALSFSLSLCLCVFVCVRLLSLSLLAARHAPFGIISFARTLPARLSLTHML